MDFNSSMKEDNFELVDYMANQTFQNMDLNNSLKIENSRDKKKSLSE
jgi:hypothetical protein